MAGPGGERLRSSRRRPSQQPGRDDTTPLRPVGVTPAAAAHRASDLGAGSAVRAVSRRGQARLECMPRYHVTIVYAEPTYAAQRDMPPREYRGGFDVDAPDPFSAMILARDLFLEAEQRSSVGWVRDILRYRCEPLAA